MAPSLMHPIGPKTIVPRAERSSALGYAGAAQTLSTLALVGSIQHCGIVVLWIGSHHHQNGKPSSRSRDVPLPLQFAGKGAVSDKVGTNSNKVNNV